MKMPKRYKRETNLTISGWMAVGFIKSEQRCCFCGEKINKAGIIIYRNHQTFAQYTWVHLNCLKDAKPSKLNKKIQDFIGVAKTEMITSETTGCSFCGVCDPNIPMYNFGYFCMHEKCVANAYKVAYGVFLDNGPNLMARML